MDTLGTLSLTQMNYNLGKSHTKKTEPMKLSVMTWTKSREKSTSRPSQKVKGQAGEHQDPRAPCEQKQVESRLQAKLETWELTGRGLFMVTSDKLYADREHQQ